MAETNGAALVITEESAFSLMDRLDEQAFLAEMAGQVIEAYIYEVHDKGRKQQGLTKVGVDAACRHLAESNVMIREIALDVRTDYEREEAFFTAKAGRYRVDTTGHEILMDTAIGIKRQPMRYQLKGGRLGEINPHWYETGAMKALRNARRRLIPEKIVLGLFEEWAKTKGRVQQLRAEEPQPAAATTAEDAAAERDAEAKMAELIGCIRDDLIRVFGERDAGKDRKLACLKAMFGTTSWTELSKRAPRAFVAGWAQAGGEKRWNAIVAEQALGDLNDE